MQRLDVNLATRPVRNTTLVWSAYAVAALALACGTWWNVATYRGHLRLSRDLATEAGSFEQQRRELEGRAERARAAIAQYDVPALHIQAAKANEIIDWKAFSWTRLFNMMERIQPGAVRMNGVRPVFHGSNQDPRAAGAAVGLPVSVEGTARTLGDIADFEQALQDDPQCGFILPENLTRADSGEIVFQLRFHYRSEPEAAEAKGAAKADAKRAKPAADPVAPAAVEVDDAWAEAGAPPDEARQRGSREP